MTTDANDQAPRRPYDEYILRQFNRLALTTRLPSSGPFPPLTRDDCPNLYPGVDYMGCFELGDNQAGWTDDDFEPTGSK